MCRLLKEMGFEKEMDSDLCSCGSTQTMMHIVNDCSLSHLNGGMKSLHKADDIARQWLAQHCAQHSKTTTTTLVLFAVISFLDLSRTYMQPSRINRIPPLCPSTSCSDADETIADIGIGEVNGGAACDWIERLVAEFLGAGMGGKIDGGAADVSQGRLK